MAAGWMRDSTKRSGGHMDTGTWHGSTYARVQSYAMRK